MALITNIKVSVDAAESSPLGLAQRSAPHSLSLSKTLTSGIASGQADVAYSATRTIAASGTDDLDLAGVLVGAFGTSTFVRVKSIFVTADAGNTNNVVIGAAAATQFVGPFGAATHTIALAPGNGFLVTNTGATGWTVTASSADFLRIANSGAGTSVTYSILIVGASA